MKLSRNVLVESALIARGIRCSKKGKIVSTPAYMLGPTIGEVAKGIEKLVADILVLL